MKKLLKRFIKIVYKDLKFIKIYFKDTPKQDIINRLKKNGFRYSQKFNCYYAIENKTALRMVNRLYDLEVF